MRDKAQKRPVNQGSLPASQQPLTNLSVQRADSESADERALDGSLQQHVPDMTNSPGRVQAFRTD